MVKLSPLQQLKLASLGGILLEPSLNRSGYGVRRSHNFISSEFLKEEIFAFYNNIDSEEILFDLIDKSLEADFYNTLVFAVELRLKYHLKHTANAIMVKASLHRCRADITKKFKGFFHFFNNYVLYDGKDVIDQLEFFIKANKGKNKMPSILKRSLAKKLASLSLAQLYKVKKYKMGIGSVIKLTHATSSSINKFIKGEKPEKEFSFGDFAKNNIGWKHVFYNCPIEHEILLDNLNKTFTTYNEIDFLNDYLIKCHDTQESSNLRPIDYVKYVFKLNKNKELNYKDNIVTSVKNLFFNALYKQKTIKEKSLTIIDCSFGIRSNSLYQKIMSSGNFGNFNNFYLVNLYGILTAKRFLEGDICKFSAEQNTANVKLTADPLSYAEYSFKNTDCIGTTGFGLYLKLKEILDKKILYDNIFIYSNCQPMHAELSAPFYEKDFVKGEYNIVKPTIGNYKTNKINVAKLLQDYRDRVNPKVNVYCVEFKTKKEFGLVESGYRTSVIEGFTGNEFEYFRAVKEFWDEFDKEKNL